MNDKTFKGLLDVAAALSEKAADESGFVSLAALAREVQADIKFRPLLVEGIAAQPKLKEDRWLILIDNETHPVTGEMLATETNARPLGSRVRNTVAHELAHALGPRYEEAIGSLAKSREEIVALLEQETEQLSPALLVPRRSLLGLLNSSSKPLSVSELVAAREKWGVSNQVFVKRFDLILQEEDSQLRYHPRIDNLIIGVGEWGGIDRVELKPMPFKGARGLLPEFASQLRNRKKIVVADYFPSPDFWLNGGSNASSSEKLWIGTSQSPRSEQAVIEITVESVSRRSGQQFLWMARQSSNPADAVLVNSESSVES